MSTSPSPLSAPTHPPAGADRDFQAGPTVGFSEKSRASMWERIEPTMTCWVWRGCTDPDGYGRFLGWPAYRVVYERMICEVPADLQLDHLCRNRLCVNPAHLEVVTPQENMRRAWAHRGGTSDEGYCINGHKYTSLDFRPSGTRRCRECKRLASRRSHEKRKARNASTQATND